MAYEGIRNGSTGGANVKIEINTAVSPAPAVWEEVCGLIDLTFSPNFKTDTFETICDGGDTVTVVLGRDMELSGTIKYDTENTIIKTIFKNAFDVTTTQTLPLKITITPIGKVFTGDWVCVPDSMSFDTEKVIEIPIMFKPYGTQEVTDTV
jgi:hypothetical protein